MRGEPPSFQGCPGCCVLFRTRGSSQPSGDGVLSLQSGREKLTPKSVTTTGRFPLAWWYNGNTLACNFRLALNFGEIIAFETEYARNQWWHYVTFSAFQKYYCKRRSEFCDWETRESKRNRKCGMRFNVVELIGFAAENIQKRYKFVTICNTWRFWEVKFTRRRRKTKNTTVVWDLTFLHIDSTRWG